MLDISKQERQMLRIALDNQLRNMEEINRVLKARSKQVEFDVNIERFKKLLAKVSEYDPTESEYIAD